MESYFMAFVVRGTIFHFYVSQIMFIYNVRELIMPVLISAWSCTVRAHTDMFNVNKLCLFSCLCIIVVIVLYFQSEIARLEENYRNRGEQKHLWCIINEYCGVSLLNFSFNSRIQIGTKSLGISPVFPESFRKKWRWHCSDIQ